MNTALPYGCKNDTVKGPILMILSWLEWRFSQGAVSISYDSSRATTAFGFLVFCCSFLQFPAIMRRSKLRRQHAQSSACVQRLSSLWGESPFCSSPLLILTALYSTVSTLDVHSGDVKRRQQSFYGSIITTRIKLYLGNWKSRTTSWRGSNSLVHHLHYKANTTLSPISEMMGSTR